MRTLSPVQRRGLLFVNCLCLGLHFAAQAAETRDEPRRTASPESKGLSSASLKVKPA